LDRAAEPAVAVIAPQRRRARDAGLLLRDGGARLGAALIGDGSVERHKGAAAAMPAGMRDDVDLFEQLMDSVICKCRMTDVVFSLADGRQARLNETPERGRR